MCNVVDGERKKGRETVAQADGEVKLERTGIYGQGQSEN